MKQMSRLGAGVILLAVMGCAQQGDMTAEREALMQADRDFNSDTQVRGGDGWAHWFAEDGVMYPNSGRVDGREAIRAVMRPVFAPGNPRLIWEPESAVVAASGDHGHTVGRWRSVGTTAAGEDSVRSRGYYLTVWKYVPLEGWRVATDMGNRDAAGDVPAEAVERAARSLDPFKRLLKKALTSGMEESPVKAIEVCNMKAPEIARLAVEALSSTGVEVGRTSHRLRNPNNAPKSWMRPILSDYVTAPELAAPRAVWVDANTVGYAEPIKAGAMCLVCHGASIAAPIAERLDTLYPDDQARGFAQGDLRGMFWVTVPVGD